MRSATLRAGALLALVLSACGDDVPPAQASLTVTAPHAPITLRSKTGCLLDGDCETGHFCFQGSCGIECSADAECQGGERCSIRGRCLSLVKEAAVWKGEPVSLDGVGPTWDEEEAAAVSAQSAQVEVIESPDSKIQVRRGLPFVEVSLRTAAPVPDGAVLYRVELDGASSARTLRAEGERDFTFQLPTGRAGSEDEPDAQRLNLITSVGSWSLVLVPKIGLNGLYAGEVAMREFGGAGVPIRFGLKIEPKDADLETATARSILLPASDQDLFSPVGFEPGAEAVWIERPLEYDEQSQVWFARFAAPFSVSGDSLLASRDRAVRTLRIELSGFSGETLLGAVADRWLGLFDSRSADGVPTSGSAALSGRLTATRASPLPAAANEPTLGSPTASTPAVGAPLAIGACSEQVFGSLLSEARASGETVCPGIGNPEQFLAEQSGVKAACALALADQALSGPSTSSQVLAFLDEDTPNPGGLSFQEFLERCAAQDGYCQPSPALECTEQLLAHAYQTQGTELPDAAGLLERFQKVAREGYLGRQLSAFQVDTGTRIEWLQKSEAPLFLASELRSYNEEILNHWKAQVLDAHFAVLSRQLASHALEVLARQPTDPAAVSAREQMLLETAQTWQGAMEALEIAASRWSALYQDTTSRKAAAEPARARMLDLYVSAAVLSQLNRAAGASASNAAFGSGFMALTRSIETLSMPFKDLVFMRDAEVVVSRSVDPSSSANTLLADREQLARRAVADAQSSVDRVLSDYQSSQLTSQVLTDRMVAQAEELRSELVEICGLPAGCSATDLDTRPECAVSVQAGQCGFLRDPGSGEYASFESLAAQPSISQAGQALLTWSKAQLEVQMAEEEFRANQERARIEYESAAAFARKVDEWDAQRRQTAAAVKVLLDEITALGYEALQVELDAIAEQNRVRQAAYAVQAASVAQFDTIRREGVQSDMEKLSQITALNQTADWLSLTGDEVDHIAEAHKESYPKYAGLVNDIAAPARAALFMSAYGITSALRAIGQGLDTAAAATQDALTVQQAMRSAQLENLADLASLSSKQTENQLAELAGRMRATELQSDYEISIREALIDELRRNLELDLAYDRDLVELRDRRDKVMLRLTESTALQVRVARAEVEASKALLDYFQLVQRAQLLDGRWRALSGRLENLNELIGSPTVIFAFANRLARAESRVERAKTLLYDWLVALEYYAVRPFVDQRLAILLARNPSQLEAIADELVRLQDACGGLVSYAVADLSVRDDLLQLGFDTEQSSSPERFRELLARGNVPIDTQVRYSSDERIGDLIASRKVLAATFTIRLDEFANLPLACNAKLYGVDVQLVGEGLGSGRPTVSILYDGTSTLRSCQPDVATIVAGLDPGSTAFAPLTTFRTSGRSVSPLATINGYGADGSANRGLEGLPLASTYTVLVDPESGENASIDWSRLEDIRLRIEWAYQDVFPEGQCQ